MLSQGTNTNDSFWSVLNVYTIFVSYWMNLTSCYGRIKRTSAQWHIRSLKIGGNFGESCVCPPPTRPQTWSSCVLPDWGHWANMRTRRAKRNISYLATRGVGQWAESSKSIVNYTDQTISYMEHHSRVRQITKTTRKRDKNINEVCIKRMADSTDKAQKMRYTRTISQQQPESWGVYCVAKWRN